MFPAQNAHTSTIPFASGSDALLLASRLIAHSRRLAAGHKAPATTGSSPPDRGSVNTITGEVALSLDICAPADAILDALEASMPQDLAALAVGVISTGGLVSDPSVMANEPDSRTILPPRRCVEA